MEAEELSEGLELIIGKELKDQKRAGKPLFYFEQNDTTKRLRYPNGERIIELYSSLNQDNVLKTILIDILKNQVYLAPENYHVSPAAQMYYTGTSPLCFYCLIELNYVNEALLSLQKREFTKNSYIAIISLIEIYLNKKVFDSKQLKLLSALFKVPEHIKEKIDDARLTIFTKKYTAVNVEINLDKVEVAKKTQILGFSHNYTGLLNSIDDFIKTESIYMNAAAISDLRSFMADLLKDIANLIVKKTGEEMSKLPNCQETGNIRHYLKEKLELSDWEDKFINSFVIMLHKKGGHTFWAEKEYFRLCKNIAIEIALLMLTKYERKYEK